MQNGGNGLAVVETNALAKSSADLSREQIDLLKETIAKGATDNELALFVQVCNRLRLDPFERQIFLVKTTKQRDGRRRGMDGDIVPCGYLGSTEPLLTTVAS